MAKGGWLKSHKQEDFYYYSTPDKKIKTPFWYSVHEVKDIGSKETLHWTVERGGTNDMGYLRNYARKNFESKDEALKYAKSWEKEIANKYKWSESKMAEGGMYLNVSEDERMEIKNLKNLIEETTEAIEVHQKLAEKSDDEETKSYHEKKVKENKKVLAQRKSRLEELTKRKMGMGGKVKFKDKVASIKASLLKRKKVPKVVQKDYGKTFSPAEAEDSAKRIVGAQTARERLMMRIKSKKKK